jgi:hypothetical protein
MSKFDRIYSYQTIKAVKTGKACNCKMIVEIDVVTINDPEFAFLVLKNVMNYLNSQKIEFGNFEVQYV